MAAFQYYSYRAGTEVGGGQLSGARRPRLIVRLGMIVAMLMLPPGSQVPPKFAAEVLWWLRWAALGIEAVLWATLEQGNRGCR